jgi:hypothetical protein
MLTPQPPLDMAVDKTAELGITIALAGIVGVALVFSFIDWFRTGRPLVLSLIVSGGAIPLALTTSEAVNAAVGWPSWLVINTDVGWVLTQVGGLATFAVACVVVKLVADAVGIPNARGEPLPRATQQVRA